jgi:hypothetical protein
MDKIDLNTFIKNEIIRISFLIETPKGLFSQLFKVPNFLSEDIIVAILSKSLLKGHLQVLEFYLIPTD